MEKILLFQFSESGWKIAAAQLEVIEKHLALGDEVLIVYCNGKGYACDLNLTKSRLNCLNCTYQTQRGLRALSHKVATRAFQSYLKEEDQALITSFGEKASLDQKTLRTLYYEDFDIGQGVISILISRFRNPYVEPFNTTPIACHLLEASLAAYLAADRAIKEFSPDTVYFFNGRGCQQRAFLEACKKHNIHYGIFEEGCDINHYEIFWNATPHSIAYRDKSMREIWNNGDRAQLIKKATDFYTNRAKGSSGYGGMKSFTAQQEKGKLPDSWNPNYHNVVIYCSSEDEFAAIGDEWKNPLYDSQLDGLCAIAQSMKEHAGNTMIYLRMHPNLINLTNHFTRTCQSIAHERFEVIPPDSPISSYDLLFACDTVVSFASTMGIEATFWEKPSLLLGRCFYQHLDVAYQPSNHQEAMEYIHADLKPKDKEGALIYIAYFLSFGKTFYMTDIGDSPLDVRFRGVHLRGNFLTRKLLEWRDRSKGPTITHLFGAQDNQ